MYIPIRCFTCGKTIAHLWDDYCNEIINHNINNETIEYISEYEINKLKNVDELKKDETIEEKILNKLNVKKYCCRRMFLTNVDLSEKI